MAELGILPNSGLTIPQLPLDIRASYFDRTPIPAPIPSTAKLSAAQGKAALYGSIADTLAKLPETLMGAYQAGRKMAVGNATSSAYKAALAGNPVAGTTLADFKATGAGDVTLNPEDPTAHLLKVEALKKQTAPSLYDTIDAGLNGGGGGLPSNSPQVGTPADSAPVGAAPVAPAAMTPDPTDTPNLDYLDGYGGIQQGNAPRLPDPNGIPKDATDAERSGLLLPPDGFKATPKPNFRGTTAPVPLSQLSDFPQVAPQDRNAIEGAAMNIGGQLTAVPESSLGASTDASAPVAAIQPVSQEQALATFADSQPQGFSQQETTDVTPPTQTVITKDPLTKIITAKTPDGRTLQIGPKENQWREVKPQGGAPTVPAMIRSEAIRMGVYKDGMTAEEVSKAMEDKQITDGIIPPHLLPQASSLARLVTQHPTLKHYPTIREAKEAVDAGLKNPDTGGFSDMALVEGFQRMVNPGATVRAQTINSMMDAAGFLQKLDPGFLWNKAVQGDKFSPEARLRIKKLADDIYERATKNAEPQLKALGRVAKSYGISNPEAFVNNVLVMSPLFDAGGSVVPEGTPGSTPGAAHAPAAVATPKDAQAAAWAKANPTDPRAATIKAAQQAKGIWVD